jgi:hypothetical protein
MPPPVQYNFTAAEELVGALRYLQQKLHDLHDLRDRLRGDKLDCPDVPQVSVPWVGQARAEFQPDFQRQQGELQRLAAQAATLLKAVNSATDQARTDQKKAHAPTG